MCLYIVSWLLEFPRYASTYVVGWLLEFYVLATSKVISGRVTICGSGDFIVLTLTGRLDHWLAIPLSHINPDTDLTSSCPVLIMLRTKLAHESIF